MTDTTLAPRYVIVAANGDFLPQPSRHVEFTDLAEARAYLALYRNPARYRIATITFE